MFYSSSLSEQNDETTTQALSIVCNESVHFSFGENWHFFPSEFPSHVEENSHCCHLTERSWHLVIPNYFDKHSGLLYLPNCNYSVEKLGRKIPLFYRELLDHFRELRSNYDDPLEDESILWNNTDRNIESENNQSFGRPGAIVMVFKTLPISSYGPWGSKLKLRKLRFPTI